MECKARVLLQDDEETIREIVASMLTQSGYECLLAETAKETLGILNAEEVDVVICGILEWSDGEEFGRMLKAFPDVPVIVCSASPRSSALPALKVGAYDFLQKPFDLEGLISHVDRALEHRRVSRKESGGNHDQATRNR
jgi:DNA-binding NtrC family response regulator